MFADELSVNKGEKKRDAARRSRLKAAAARKKKQDYIDKVEKERVAAERVAAERVAAENAAQTERVEGEKKRDGLDTTLPPLAGAESPPDKSMQGTAASPPKPPFSATSLDPSPPSSQPPSSKERLMAESKLRREERASKRKVERGVVALQSTLRMKLERAEVMKSKRKEYDGKITTLLQLAQAQKKKTSSTYIASPASIRELADMLLFLTSRASHERDGQRVAIFAGHIFMPGMGGKDENMHPLISWVGGEKMKRFIALCLKHIKEDDSFVQGTLGRFLSTLLMPSRDLPLLKEVKELTRYARYIVFSMSNIRTNIVKILRSHLLSSLPTYDVEFKLDNETRRRRTSALFQLTFEACNYDLENEQTRAWLISTFAAEILSVPLLNKRVSDEDLVLISLNLPSLSKAIVGMRELHGNCEIQALLPQYSLVEIPVPPILALFGNIVSALRLSKDQSEEYADAILKYAVPLLTGLIEEIPIGSFGSKSTVQWVKVGTSNKAIVVPEAVIEQSKGFCLDFVIRKLWAFVLGGGVPDSVVEEQMENIISRKDKEDVKLEKWDGGGGMTAKEMAVKDAKPERKKSFFGYLGGDSKGEESSSSSGSGNGGSSWAKKLSRLLGGSKKKKKNKDGDGMKGEGFLVNTSKMSRDIAGGGGGGGTLVNVKLNETTATKSGRGGAEFNISRVRAIAPLFCVLLSRWGGTGCFNIVSRRRLNESDATTFPEPAVLGVLNVLNYSTCIMKVLWAHLQDPSTRSDLEEVLEGKEGPMVLLNMGGGGKRGKTMACCSLFAALMSNALVLTDDDELLQGNKPLPLFHLRRIIVLFKRLVWKACSDGRAVEGAVCGIALVKNLTKVLNDLHDTHSRTPFCGSKLWLVEGHAQAESQVNRGRRLEDFVAILSSPAVQVVPYGVSLRVRMRLFERLVGLSKAHVQGVNEEGTLRPGRRVRIQRGRILEDGLATMNVLGPRLRERIMVQYTNEFGVEERGIDVGGLFKDFWSDLSELAFSPGYALFSETERGELYPSPIAMSAHGSDGCEQLFTFLGRIVGKALYENIVIQPVFAHFFLSFMKGGYNYNNMLSDLATKDRELYKNLMFLKDYEGDAEDLCLTFTVTQDDFGSGGEVELIPGGKDVDVTDRNKMRYIHLVAKYHMSDRIKLQSEAFRRGLGDVIEASWLRMFNEQELQILISGVGSGDLDIADLKRNVRYSGGFTGIDRNISNFWNAVESMTAKEQRQLIKFVTSCERAPSLGFAALDPPFTIQRIGISHDTEKLPSASTCFNILKLPTYSSKKVMKEKLLVSITSGTGFEMS